MSQYNSLRFELVLKRFYAQIRPATESQDSVASLKIRFLSILSTKYPLILSILVLFQVHTNYNDQLGML
jgi:hypothetical protein